MTTERRCAIRSDLPLKRFAAVLAAAVVLTSIGCSRSISIEQQTTRRKAPLPLIANPKPLPCPSSRKERQTTIGLERCSEGKVYTTNATINRKVREIVELLSDKREKTLFTIAEVKWQQYRQAECESEADRYRGGSAQRAIFAECLFGINREHVDRLEKEHDFLVATRR